MVTLSQKRDGTLLINNVNIIDVINGKVVEDKSVPVKGNRLADILPTPSHAKATTTLDGKGKYLTHRFFEFISEGVRLMDFARIPMLLGTDAPVPPMVQGKALHWECSCGVKRVFPMPIS